MASLPTPGGSDGVWGPRLNEYLGVEHDSGGAHEIVLVGARMYLNTAQNDLVTATETKVTLDTDSYDYNTLTDTANNKITVDKDGLYLVNCQVTFTNATNNIQLRLDVKKNGSIIGTSIQNVYVGGSYTTFAMPFQTISSSSATDYFELFATVTGASTVDLTTGSAATFMEVYRIGVSAS